MDSILIYVTKRWQGQTVQASSQIPRRIIEQSGKPVGQFLAEEVAKLDRHIATRIEQASTQSPNDLKGPFDKPYIPS